jgi:hypothetical protein
VQRSSAEDTCLARLVWRFTVRGICRKTYLSLGPEVRSGHDYSAGGGAAMQHIADWLDKLGMSEYAQRFAENRIDFSVLPDLTDQHLKDLGIALGDS